MVYFILVEGIYGNNANENRKMEKTQPNTVEEARQQAIAWQQWQSEQSLSYGEVAEWEDHFTAIAKKFNLTEEFKENGII